MARKYRQRGFTLGGGIQDPFIARELETIYGLLNQLYDRANSYGRDDDISYRGTPGDIRVVKRGETEGDTDYAIQAKTPDGWLQVQGQLQTKEAEGSGGFPPSKHYLPLTPDYDSGWVQDAANDAVITLTHNLGVVDFRFHDLQLSNLSSGAKPTWIHMSDNKTGGYIVQIHDENTIKVGTSDDGPPEFGCTGLGWEGAATHFRLRLWK